MRRILLLLVICFAGRAYAATCNAATCSQADVQSAINSCTGSGDTVVIPAGTCSWATPVTIANKLGTASVPYTIQGATTCPGAAGTPLVGPTPCTDLTTINDNTGGAGAILRSGYDSTHVVRMTGITFNQSSADGNGLVRLSGTYGTIGERWDHIHMIAPSGGGRGFYPNICCVLIDHLWGDVTGTTGSHQVVSIDGTSEGGDGGSTPWTLPMVFGGATCTFIEDSYFSVAAADAGTEDQIDAYSGACVVIRYTNFLNSTQGFHGTDSGGQRSPVIAEVYNNNYVNNSSTTLRGGTIRGGTGVYHDSNFSGSHGSWNPITLQVQRTNQFNNSADWGICDGNQNWMLGSTNPGTNAGRQNSNGGPDWTTLHTYAGTVNAIQPTSNNAGNFNYTSPACTSAAGRPAFTQSVLGTTSDGTCTWTNEGGRAAGVGAKWCAINRDTICTADATCNAITGGDTCSTYFDGGLQGTSGYACRDQPGRAHNQVLTPIYAWNLTGQTVTLDEFPTSSYLTAGVDYINNGSTPKPGYTPYTYPNPLQGTTQVSTPFATPAGGTYAGTQTVTIATATSGATLCYTIDGTTPTANGAGTCTHGTTYTVPFPVAVSLTVKTIGSKAGDTDSVVDTEVYTITAPPTPGASGTGLTGLGVIVQ